MPCAGFVSAIEVGDGEDEAVGFLRTVQILDEFFSDGNLVLRRVHDNGVLCRHQINLDAGVDHVADRDENFVGVIQLHGVGEIERFVDLIAGVGTGRVIGLLSVCGDGAEGSATSAAAKMPRRNVREEAVLQLNCMFSPFRGW